MRISGEQSEGGTVSIATQPGVYCTSMGSTGQEDLAGGWSEEQQLPSVCLCVGAEWGSEAKVSLADRIVITGLRQAGR